MGYSCIDCSDSEFGICPSCRNEESDLPYPEMSKREFDRRVNKLISEYFKQRRIANGKRKVNLQKDQPSHVGSGSSRKDS